MTIDRIGDPDVQAISTLVYRDASQMVAHLEECIFEGLPSNVAKEWPMRFMMAIKPKSDLSLVGWKFLHWLLTDKNINPGIDHDLVCVAVRRCADVISSMANGGAVDIAQAKVMRAIQETRATWAVEAAKAAATAEAVAAAEEAKSAARAAWEAAVAATSIAEAEAAMTAVAEAQAAALEVAAEAAAAAAAAAGAEAAAVAAIQEVALEVRAEVAAAAEAAAAAAVAAKAVALEVVAEAVAAATATVAQAEALEVVGKAWATQAAEAAAEAVEVVVAEAESDVAGTVWIQMADKFIELIEAAPVPETIAIA